MFNQILEVSIFFYYANKIFLKCCVQQMALQRGYGSIDNHLAVPLAGSSFPSISQTGSSTELRWAKDTISQFAGFNCRKLLEVNLSTSESCACKVDAEVARVRMSSACR